MKEIKRLNYGDRRTIQDMLDAHERLCRIAEAVLADPTSVSRGIRRNRTALGSVAPSRFRPITCDLFGTCERRDVCGTGCTSRCRSCQDVRCEEVCPSFAEFSCAATGAARGAQGDGQGDGHGHRPPGKCLLTFCTREDEAFYAVLMDSKEAGSVREAVDGLEIAAFDGGVAGELGEWYVLTDRGPEFDRFEEIERSCFTPGLPERRLRVFYCDPYCSWQKPHVENAHTLLRRVLPKGSSFDDLTQEDADLVCSYINSYPRAELGWRSPFEMLPEWGRENLPAAFGMRIVPRDEVDLTPSLIGR